MRLYETVTITDPDLTEERMNEIVSRIESEIEKGGGKIAEINQWGVRKLAYRIQRQARGYYTIFQYAAPHSLVRELEYQLRVLEGIIRFLTIKLEEDLDENALGALKKVHTKPEPAPESEVEEEPEEEPEEDEEEEEEEEEEETEEVAQERKEADSVDDSAEAETEAQEDKKEEAPETSEPAGEEPASEGDDKGGEEDGDKEEQK